MKGKRKKRSSTPDKVPTTPLARGRVAAKVAVTVGAKKVKLLSKRPFLSGKKYAAERDKHEDEVARTIFKGLAQLRGTALKIAQLLSLEMGVLPEHYRKELYKSHYRAPPLNRAVSRRLIKTELGAPANQIFAEFAAEAFAAASLGQVHRAVAKDGRELAVKVQYPGIGDAVKTDLSVARRVLDSLYHSDYLNRAFDEIGARLAEEIDYRKEFENTLWFHNNFHHEGIIFPEPVAKYSSERVLATTFQEGSHIDQWLATDPPRELRDRFGQLLLDFFLASLFDRRRFHADPNPGNFLFREDGQVAVVDFGCVKSYTEDLAGTLRTIMTAAIRADHAAALEMYQKLGLRDTREESLQHLYESLLLPIDEWVARPFRVPVFDFHANRGYCVEGADLLRESTQHKSLEAITTETIYMDRNFHGLYRILEQLEARVSFANPWIG